LTWIIHSDFKRRRDLQKKKQEFELTYADKFDQLTNAYDNRDYDAVISLAHKFESYEVGDLQLVARYKKEAQQQLNDDETYVIWGFRFGMSRDEARDVEKKLMEEGRLYEVPSSGYPHAMIESNGRKVECKLELDFNEWELNQVKLIPEDLSGFSVLRDFMTNRMGQPGKNSSGSYEYGSISYCDWTSGRRETGVSHIRRKSGGISVYLKFADKSNAEEYKVRVRNSPYDNSVYQVEQYLKSVLKDPDSYQPISWGNVQEFSDGYTVRHTYRAKNSFGGYVVESKTFMLDNSGSVIGVR